MIIGHIPAKMTMPDSNQIQAQKRHYEISDKLTSKNEQIEPYKNCGKKMDLNRPVSDIVQYKPHVRAVQTRIKGEELTNDAQYQFGKRMIEFQAREKIQRPEQKHFNPNPSIQTGENVLKSTADLNNFYSARWNSDNRPDLYKGTYDPQHSATNQYLYSHEKIQTKKIYSYDQTRNSIPVLSLGDKAYSHPTYSPGFYNEPGVYPGSTNALRKRNRAKINMVDFTISKEAKYPFYPTVKYSDRVEIDRLTLERAQVLELDTWEDKFREGAKSDKDPVGKNDDKNKAKKPAPAPVAKKK